MLNKQELYFKLDGEIMLKLEMRNGLLYYGKNFYDIINEKIDCSYRALEVAILRYFRKKLNFYFPYVSGRSRILSCRTERHLTMS